MTDNTLETTEAPKTPLTNKQKLKVAVGIGAIASAAVIVFNIRKVRAEVEEVVEATKDALS